MKQKEKLLAIIGLILITSFSLGALNRRLQKDNKHYKDIEQELIEKIKKIPL